MSRITPARRRVARSSRHRRYASSTSAWSDTDSLMRSRNVPPSRRVSRRPAASNRSPGCSRNAATGNGPASVPHQVRGLIVRQDDLAASRSQPANRSRAACPPDHRRTGATTETRNPCRRSARTATRSAIAASPATSDWSGSSILHEVPEMPLAVRPIGSDLLHDVTNLRRHRQACLLQHRERILHDQE